MTAGRKLAVGGAVIASVTAYMAYLGAAADWRYSMTTDECLADAKALAGAQIRVSGRIAPGSLSIAPDRTRAKFSLAGRGGRLAVVCLGPLPDNLAEEVDVVVEGLLDDSGILQGEKALTRCAGKYESQKQPAVETDHR